MIYGHGDDAHSQTHPIRDDFSSNTRPDGPPSELIDHLRARLTAIARYPEPAADTVRRQLAAAHHVSAAQVLVTAGATAAIYLVAQTHRARASLILTPTFSEYEDACRLHDHALAFAPRSAFLAAPAAFLAPAPANAATPDLLWLCNPNTPPGEAAPRDALLALIDAHPRTRFVIDQSYADFCPLTPIQPADTTARENLILIRSLTKTLGIPGLRIGHVFASASNIAALARHLQPWAVNTLALEAAAYYLAHRARLAPPLESWLAHARALSRAVADLEGYTPLPTATPFFLIELARGTSSALKQHLVEKHGILIRNAANFRGLTSRHIRVSPQSPWQNHRLAQALQTYLGTPASFRQTARGIAKPPE
ncbi:MAG: histidinol-phosphate aminotransferase family protein [Opitutaceae bacterium]|jgi:threonine-phosphate decarboxylase|nr:histidinol-phosphate aminotransferase family protein [Opitutaceae bacterium]